MIATSSRGLDYAIRLRSSRDEVIRELQSGGAAGHFGRDKTVAMVEDRLLLTKSQEGCG